MLPSKCVQVPTGFVRQKAVTVPTVDEVRGNDIHLKSLFDIKVYMKLLNFVELQDVRCIYHTASFNGASLQIALINCLRRFMQVRKVAIDTRIASAPIDVRPRHKPYLHKLRAKDPVELENKGYGPGKQ